MWTVWEMTAFTKYTGTNGGLTECWQSTRSITEREPEGRDGDGGRERVSREAGREGGSEGVSSWGWVLIKPSSGGLTCLECVSESVWFEGQALCCCGALEVLSYVQTPCLRYHKHTHTCTHTHTHNKENTIITFKLVNPDMLIERYCSILSGKSVYKLILQK